jgi:hypothetical protein
MPRVIRESETRENELIGFIGTNRTGKTSKAVSMAEVWRDNNDGPIMCFDPQNKFGHISDFNIVPSDDKYKEEILRMRDGLIILDDYRILHSKGQTETWMSDLMHFRNAYNLDIFYITHSPALVLNINSYYTTKYYVFYTESTLGSWQKKIPNYHQCQAASLYINKYVSVKGKGKYPDFPYVMVDNQNKQVTGVNILK